MARQVNHGKRIIVLLDGGPADQPVIEMACLLGKQFGGRLYLVRALVVDRQQPLDAELPEATAATRAILDRARTLASERGCLAETRELRTRDVASALVDEAADLGCDQIVLGISAEPRPAVQTIADHVLRHAPCPVWLYRAHRRRAV